MSNTIPFENFEDIHQDIPRQFSFLRQKLVTLAFIPRRLAIPERPELNDFPLNIIFSNRVDIPKGGDIRLALYEPDFSTFESKEGKKELIYRNTHGGDSQVKVIKEAKGYYTGVRTIKGVDKNFVNGETWKFFFLYLSLYGIFGDEAYINLPASVITEAFPPKAIPEKDKEILTAPEPIKPYLTVAQNNVNADSKAVEEIRLKAKTEPDKYLSQLAKNLSDLGLSLSGAGQKDDAVKVTREALEIARSLNEGENQENPILLGVILNNFGNRLYEQGKIQEAIETVNEAEVIFRKLAKDYGGTPRGDHARSLIDSAQYLSKLNKNDEALKLAQEAVELSRKLVNENAVRYRSFLARGLFTLSNSYRGLGLFDESYKAGKEAEMVSDGMV